MAKKKETFIDRRNRLLETKGGQTGKPNGKAGQAIAGGADRGGLAGVVKKKRKK